MKKLTLILMTSALACSCSQAGGGDPEDEVAQAIGDQMAAADEVGGSTGTYARLDEISAGRRALARRLGETPSLVERLVPSAQAVTCLSSPGFGTCTSNVITRTFGGCTVLGATFDGTVTFTWGGGAAACSMSAQNHTVARAPNFTITGRRGGTFTASTVGTNGQMLTKGAAAGEFSFTNDGIRRKLVDSFGGTVADFTTQTTAAMAITGTSRAGRLLDGGTLRVTNNLTTVTCDFTPVNVTWTAG
ncbi:MAG TPA: hypothetical protein VM598_12325, partial [Bdellovibrionota bacterium]|nr:hypothetical protein [Bdellovibrionota bacterium]